MLNKKGVNMGKIRFNITKDGLSFIKGNGKLSVPIDRGVKYCPTCRNRHPITKDGIVCYTSNNEMVRVKHLLKYGRKRI